MPDLRQILASFARQTASLRSVMNTLKAHREAHSAFANPDSPPIIIYQMGKVGSTAVCKSLLDASIRNPILQLHFLSDDISEHRRTHKRAGINPSPYHLYLGEAVRAQLDEHQSFPLKVISLVRDPIAFLVSDLFENPYFAGEEVLTASGSINPEGAGNYIDRKLNERNTFDYMNDWFDRELMTVFGVDVFADPFPIETGYVVYSKDNVDVLLIRLEDLSAKGPMAIADFLGLGEPLTIVDSNRRADSTAKDVYQDVRDGISLDPALVEEIYSSRFVRHFYNEAMINEFISTWTRKQAKKRPLDPF